MTAILSLLTAVLLYSTLQYLKYKTAGEHCMVGGQKSNVGSKLIYLFAVVLFTYRFERQPWKLIVQPLRLLFDALSVLVTFELLYSFFWLRIEYFFLELVPSVLNENLEMLGLPSQIPEWPFIVTLYAISLFFLLFAHNSDRYIDHYLDLEEDVHEDVSINQTMDFLLDSLVPLSTGGFGEVMGRTGDSLQAQASARLSASPRGRGTHTLARAPVRRSARIQNRSPVHSNY